MVRGTGSCWRGGKLLQHEAEQPVGTLLQRENLSKGIMYQRDPQGRIPARKKTPTAEAPSVKLACNTVGATES